MDISVRTEEENENEDTISVRTKEDKNEDNLSIRIETGKDDGNISDTTETDDEDNDHPNAEGNLSSQNSN